MGKYQGTRGKIRGLGNKMEYITQIVHLLMYHNSSSESDGNQL